MNIIKRFTCVFLVSVMSLCFAAYAAETENSENFIENLAILKSVGINIDLSAENEVIDREKLSEYALSLTGLQKRTALSAKFTDIPLKHYASDLVYSVDYYNLVDPKENNLFALKEDATVYEFGKILLYMLGYNLLEEESDTSIYTKWLYKTALLNGVKSSVLTQGNAATMLINLLTEPVASVKSITADGVEYYFNEDKLYISEKLNAVKKEGRLQAVGETALVGRTPVVEGRIVINGVVYECDNEELVNSLGSIVTFYCTNDDSFDFQKIIHISAKKSYKELNIAADDILRFSDGRLYYEKNGKSTYVSININKMLVIQNGKRASSVNEMTFCPAAGGLRFTDTDNDGTYDICFVTSKIYYIVSEAIENTGFISDKMTKYSISADKNNISVYSDGVKTGFDAIAKGAFAAILPDGISYKSVNSVLIPFGSSGLKNLKVDITGNITEGTITEKSNDGITVYDSETQQSTYLEYSKWYKNMVKAGLYEEPDIDASVKVYTDSGKVVIIDEESIYVGSGRKTTYGYLVGISEGTGAFEPMCFKIFTEYGEMNVYNSAEKVKLNGTVTSYSGFLSDLNLYQNGTLEKQLISFKLNANEEITEINTAVNYAQKEITQNGITVPNPNYSNSFIGYDENCFSLDYASEDETYRGAGFKHLYAIKPDTKVFVIPIDSDLDKYYQIRSQSYFVGSSNYNIKLYDVQRTFTTSACVVFVKAKSGGGEIPLELYQGNVSSMVADKVTAVDDNGEIRPLVYFSENQYPYYAGKTTAMLKGVFASDDEMTSYNGSRFSGGPYPGIPYTSLERGDVVMFKTNDFGEMNTFRILARYRDMYDSEGNWICNEINRPTDSMYITRSVVKDIFDDYSFIFNADPTGSQMGLRYSVQGINDDNLAVQLYDMSDTANPIKSVSLKELRIGDNIVTRSESGKLIEVFIYRK